MIPCDVQNSRQFCGALCPRTEKTLPLTKTKEAQIAVNREKDREITIFCSIMSFQYFCVASCNNNPVLVGFSLINLESLGFL